MVQYPGGSSPAFLISICQPRADYGAKNNAQHVQNMFIPAIRREAWICRCVLKQDEAQEAYRDAGYQRGGDDCNLFVIVRHEVDDYSHKRGGRNRSCDKDDVCADDENPVHIRRFPKFLDTVKPMEDAECDADRMVRREPQHDTGRNRDGPSKNVDGWIIAHRFKQVSKCCIGSPQGWAMPSALSYNWYKPRTQSEPCISWGYPLALCMRYVRMLFCLPIRHLQAGTAECAVAVVR